MHPEYAQLVRLLPEPAMLVDGSGKVLMANDAMAELAGTRSQALTGLTIATLAHEPREKIDEYLRLCSRSRQLVPGAISWLTDRKQGLQTRCDGATLIPRAGNEPALLFIRCRPKDEATDHFTLLNRKIEALSQEILERKKAERERDRLLQSERDARLDAERVSRIKDEFLANISHELRTPLNAILGWSQVLLSGAAVDAQQQGLRAIERNARAQAQIIGDLLDMSSIISGKVRLDVQSLSPVTVIEAAADAIRPACDAKSIRLQLTLDPLAGPIKGDPGRLQQVLWNLLTNSVRFTKKGGRIQVLLERVNSHIEISVVDDGSGISPEFLPYVFDRFRQEDASITRQHGGLGLGLAIVKHLVELHGGSVRAKSAGLGKGATFTVSLPVVALQQSLEPAREHPASPSPSTIELPAGMLDEIGVLVIDDDTDARELLAALLERQHATVYSAASAAEGLALFKQRRPNIVLCDIGMPGQDGYAFVRALRALPDEDAARVPVVAVTAFARSEDRARAMLAGFTGHLSKPLEATELIAMVAGLSRRT